MQICQVKWNYRGISLIDVAAKVFVALLQRRFQGARDTRVRLGQSGFRPGRGCIDQIFSLSRTLENRGCYLVLVRPILEYVLQASSPLVRRDIILMERMQHPAILLM